MESKIYLSAAILNIHFKTNHYIIRIYVNYFMYFVYGLLVSIIAA